MESEILRVALTTFGRKTGKEHIVWLRGVKYSGKYYFSRHKPDSDWFQNAVKNEDVVIDTGESKVRGKARQVLDEKLSQKISELKYPGEERAKEKRVTIEVTLCE
ncbi:MAG: nitroreductase/quinone reductase family protein [Nitrosopumilaceae archaeon]|nr:nitroreductase/quinone reductase family protein [Nitrosopumilaceae archaeon]